MSAKKEDPPTNKEAFNTLVLDGQRLSVDQAEAHFRPYNAEGRHDGAAWKDELFQVIRELMHGEEPALSARTSGTTGPPKQIHIAYDDLLNSAQLTRDAFGLREGDRVLLCLPCSYIAGKMMVVRALALGLDLHVIDPSGSIMGNLRREERFRFTPMVPLQLQRAIREERQRVEEQFQTILLGGGPVSAVLEKETQNLRTEVFQGYGSTETVTHVALRRINGPDREEEYRAIGQVTFATDERGCLVVNTPHLTRQCHITNDLVELIDATRFRWLGRLDNVILSGGKKVHPELLEAKTAGVIPYAHYFTAVPDDRLGYAVALVLEVEEDQQLIDAVLQDLARVLSKHEMPRKVLTQRSFERTAAGKVIRAR